MANPMLSEVPRSWTEIFAELDEVGVPVSYLADRDQGDTPEPPEFEHEQPLNPKA